MIELETITKAIQTAIEPLMTKYRADYLQWVRDGHENLVLALEEAEKNWALVGVFEKYPEATELKKERKMNEEQWFELTKTHYKFSFPYNRRYNIISNSRVGKTRWNTLGSISLKDKRMSQDWRDKKEEELQKMVDKSIENKRKSIDRAVNKKIRHKFTHILPKYIREGRDGGIEGKWLLYTENNEEYTFEFFTFYAGGWNVQALHIRTQYNYKLTKKQVKIPDNAFTNQQLVEMEEKRLEELRKAEEKRKELAKPKKQVKKAKKEEKPFVPYKSSTGGMVVGRL